MSVTSPPPFVLVLISSSWSVRISGIRTLPARPRRPLRLLCGAMTLVALSAAYGAGGVRIGSALAEPARGPVPGPSDPQRGGRAAVGLGRRGRRVRLRGQPQLDRTRVVGIHRLGHRRAGAAAHRGGLGRGLPPRHRGDPQAPGRDRPRRDPRPRRGARARQTTSGCCGSGCMARPTAGSARRCAARGRRGDRTDTCGGSTAPTRPTTGTSTGPISTTRRCTTW